MEDSPFLGTGRFLIPLPAWLWRREVAAGARRLAASLAFMSEDHHRVRYFVVREIPRAAKPLTPEFIAESLRLPRDRVIQILEELERNLTFLFRNREGSVAWAYPVTTDPTPHRVRFSTGEEVSAA
jgi:hypothetical protein